jgi:hypothetical protein
LVCGAVATDPARAVAAGGTPAAGLGLRAINLFPGQGHPSHLMEDLCWRRPLKAMVFNAPEHDREAFDQANAQGRADPDL